MASAASDLCFCESRLPPKRDRERKNERGRVRERKREWNRGREEGKRCITLTFVFLSLCRSKGDWHR